MLEEIFVMVKNEHEYRAIQKLNSGEADTQSKNLLRHIKNNPGKEIQEWDVPGRGVTREYNELLQPIALNHDYEIYIFPRSGIFNLEVDVKTIPIRSLQVNNGKIKVRI